ncbi:uncharacterized protein A1O9_00582, partial [Exophiala aquamarina CBS 119918]
CAAWPANLSLHTIIDRVQCSIGSRVGDRPSGLNHLPFMDVRGIAVHQEVYQDISVKISFSTDSPSSIGRGRFILAANLASR